MLIPNALWCNHLVRLSGMQKVVGLNPHGSGRNFSHGKLSKMGVLRVSCWSHIIELVCQWSHTMCVFFNKLFLFIKLYQKHNHFEDVHIVLP